MIQLDGTIIEKLGWKGVLAYLAASISGGGLYRTAVLASAVNCTTPVMNEGMNELMLSQPHIVQWLKQDQKWLITGDANAVTVLEEKAERRHALIDDLKIYWDCLNKGFPFCFTAKDSVAVSNFLKGHRAWTHVEWRQALNNRARSEINKSQPIYLWIGRLHEYAAGPLDKFMKPMEHGGGAGGKALSIEAANRAARESVTGSH
jgi:hypothetical protein